MYCVNCGTQLPDHAKFCSGCGTPQTSGIAAAPPPRHVETDQRRETCEIKCRETESGFMAIYNLTWIFYADCIGPNERYQAAQSSPFKAQFVYAYGASGGPQLPERCPASQTALDDLVSRLEADGWEPLLRGEYWFSQRFERRVTQHQVSAREREHDREAANFLDHLRRNGVRVSASKDFSELTVKGTKLKPETQATLQRLRPHLLRLLKDEATRYRR